MAQLSALSFTYVETAWKQEEKSGETTETRFAGVTVTKHQLG